MHSLYVLKTWCIFSFAEYGTLLNEMVNTRMEEMRTKGRTRGRWTDEVKKVLKKIGIRNWHTVARDRKEWWRIVLEAKVHNGM
jgi:hypothetical protein